MHMVAENYEQTDTDTYTHTEQLQQPSLRMHARVNEAGGSNEERFMSVGGGNLL